MKNQMDVKPLFSNLNCNKQKLCYYGTCVALISINSSNCSMSKKKNKQSMLKDQKKEKKKQKQNVLKDKNKNFLVAIKKGKRKSRNRIVQQRQSIKNGT